MNTLRILSSAGAHASLSPVILTAKGKDIDCVLAHPLARRASAYIETWVAPDGTRHSYVGSTGGDVTTRLRVPEHHQPMPMDRVFVITGEREELTAAEAGVAERIFSQMLSEQGSSLYNKHLPYGGLVDDREYCELRRFCSTAATLLKRSNLLFQNVSDRSLAAGPVAYLSGRRFTERDGVPPITLSNKAASARAVEWEGKIHLQPGSLIRREMSPAASTVGILRRQEALYGGAIEPAGPQHLLVKKPMMFSSHSAATRFVLGSSAGSPGAWRKPDGTRVESALGKRIEAFFAGLIDRVCDTTTAAISAVTEAEDREGFRHGL